MTDPSKRASTPVPISERPWYDQLVLGVALALTTLGTVILDRAIAHSDRTRFAATVNACEDRILHRMHADPHGEHQIAGPPASDRPGLTASLNKPQIPPSAAVDPGPLLAIRIRDADDGLILFDTTTDRAPEFALQHRIQTPELHWDVDYQSSKLFEKESIWWLVPLFAGIGSLLAFGLYLLARAKIQALNRNLGLYRIAMTARRSAELSLDINRRLASSLDPQAVAQAVTDAGCELTGAAFGGFVTVGPQAGGMAIYALSGVASAEFQINDLPLVADLLAATVAGQEVIRRADVGSDAVGRHVISVTGPPQVSSYLAVSVRSRTGQILGGLLFTHPAPGRFTESHESLIIGLATQAAIAFDHARMHAAEREALRLASDRANDLGRVNTELQQFIYVSSHDLQEPLRTITQYLDLLQRRHAGQLDEQARRYMSYASDSAARMYTLLNDLLTYSRLGQEPERTLELLAEIIAEVIQDLGAGIAETRALISVGPMPRLRCDRGRIRSLFQNLLGNAMKFRGEADPRIRITAELDPQGAWIISVADNGIGVPEEHREAVFEVFHRLHDRGSFPGTGIGLAICRKVVEQHGGTIRISETPGGGATVSFTLNGCESAVRPAVGTP